MQGSRIKNFGCYCESKLLSIRVCSSI
uniref:Uncharacterized protein n=1 Tax=Rhizophora mucronata TaxID=61149 RepID=A0A2P2QJX9_RHIMU